jgi:hypothetical protein
MHHYASPEQGALGSPVPNPHRLRQSRRAGIPGAAPPWSCEGVPADCYRDWALCRPPCRLAALSNTSCAIGRLGIRWGGGGRRLLWLDLRYWARQSLVAARHGAAVEGPRREGRRRHEISALFEHSGQLAHDVTTRCPLIGAASLHPRQDASQRAAASA